MAADGTLCCAAMQVGWEAAMAMRVFQGTGSLALFHAAPRSAELWRAHSKGLCAERKLNVAEAGLLAEVVELAREVAKAVGRGDGRQLQCAVLFDGGREANSSIGTDKREKWGR